jgi:hypothetical protein
MNISYNYLFQDTASWKAVLKSLIRTTTPERQAKSWQKKRRAVLKGKMREAPLVNIEAIEQKV